MLDLDKLQEKLDSALASETSESLKKWLLEQEMKKILTHSSTGRDSLIIPSIKFVELAKKQQ